MDPGTDATKPKPGLRGAAIAALTRSNRIIVHQPAAQYFEPYVGSTTWEFASGKWTALSEDPLGSGCDIDKAIAEAGYSLAPDCADEQPVVVFSATKSTTITNRWRFLVQVDTNCGLDCIFLPDLSDLLLIAPILKAFGDISDRQELSNDGNRSRRAA
jgi:hypothetical protein